MKSRIAGLQLILLLLLFSAYAAAIPAMDIRGILIEKYQISKDAASAVKSTILERRYARDVVKFAVQMNWTVCVVIKAAIEAGANPDHVLLGAVEGGASKDVVAQCAIDAGLDPSKVAMILGLEDLSPKSISTDLPGDKGPFMSPAKFR